MDRESMSKPRSSAEYKLGVEEFLSFAYRDVPLAQKILCPCVNCANRATQIYEEVKTHLRCDGIVQDYTRWVFHGEECDAPSVAFAHISENSSSFAFHGIPTNNVVQDGHKRMDDMLGLINSAFGTQSEIGGMEPDVADSWSAPSEKGDARRESLLKDANIKLHYGCEAFSRLSFIVTIYHMKVLHGWSQKSFTQLLGVLSNALPLEAKLPKTYYEAKKIVRYLGLDYVKIHACPQDCMLFRGDRSNQESCHVCGRSRWLADDKGGAPVLSKKNRRIPVKVLRYFPLTPRLFSTTKTSDDIRWHDEGRTKDEFLRHPADGECWKNLDFRYPDFAEDARHVRLGLASDGFNPFRNMSYKHSTWPVMLIPYNLPPWICMKQTSLILSMIIPRPHSPGNDIDIYLQPLVDELQQLWEGVDTYDASTERKFSLRAALLWTLNDFPALVYLYGWTTSGQYACPSCAASTYSRWLKKGMKRCYMGHRRWLPHNHSYRRSKMQFDNTEETKLAPKTMSGSSALNMLQGRVFVLGKKFKVATKNKGQKTGKNKNKGKANSEGQKRKRKVANKKSGNNPGKRDEKKPEDWFKKKSIFFNLPYWEDNKLRHNLDVMHIEKNVCDNLIGTLLDIDSKTKDGLNARHDLYEIGIRPELQPFLDEKGRDTYHPAPFTMCREKKEMLCSIIKNIRTPDGYASNISRCVNMKDCTFTGMKSHDCHVLIEEILSIALRSCYPSKEVMAIVIGLANFFKKLCSKVLKESELDELQESIVMTLCDMERIFLLSFFTVMVHLMVHLVEEVRLGGPVHYRWMYPLERSFVRLKSFVHNRAHPEGSIAEGYIGEECLTFCSRFLEGSTVFTKPSRNPDPSDNKKDTYMFGNAGESIGNGTIVSNFDNQLLIHAHRYVLRHCDELEDLRNEFLDHEKSKLSHVTSLTPAVSDKLINKHFADWFEQKVLQQDGLRITEKIRSLAAKPNKYGKRYNGYIINGFRFHTMSRETGHVAKNSGVLNIAANGISYYGRLSDIWELSYKDYKVVLFKCDWYDVHHRAGFKEDEFGFTLVNFSRKIHTSQTLDDDPFVFSSQVKQVFYVEDPKYEGWNTVAGDRPPRDFFDMGEESSNESDDLSDSSGEESLDEAY